MYLNKRNLQIVFCATGIIAAALMVFGAQKVGIIGIDKRMNLFGAVIFSMLMQQAWTGLQKNPKLTEPTSWGKILPTLLLVTMVVMPLGVTLILGIIWNLS